MDRTNKTSPNEFEFIVPEITCGGCAKSIQAALTQIECIRGVDVDIADKRVRLTADCEVDRERVTEALDNAGFSVVWRVA